MANAFRNDTFRNPVTLSYILLALFGVIIFCNFIYVASSFGQLLWPDSTIELDDSETISFAAMLLGLSALLEIPTRIATIIFFLIWIYRCFNNLSPLRARDLEFTPGWAVGWWFIPFANLVKPYQVVCELWHGSDPDFDTELGFISNAVGSPSLVGFWWGFYLISNIVSRVVDSTVDNFETSSFAPVGFTVMGILVITAAILAMTVVRSITQKQLQRFQRIGSLDDSQLPPPPPVFEK